LGEFRKTKREGGKRGGKEKKINWRKRNKKGIQGIFFLL
jgi:hypothetical protein